MRLAAKGGGGRAPIQIQADRTDCKRGGARFNPTTSSCLGSGPLSSLCPPDGRMLVVRPAVRDVQKGSCPPDGRALPPARKVSGAAGRCWSTGGSAVGRMVRAGPGLVKSNGGIGTTENEAT